MTERAEPVTSTINEHDRHLVVRTKKMLTDEIVLLTLGSVDGSSLPTWTPGSHIDLILPNGLIRQYSLCGDTLDTDSWQVAVLRDHHSRGGSQFIHDQLGEGDRLWVTGPRNHFALVDADSYLFLAGGIGVTPLVPMAAAAERAGVEWSMIYCARNRDAMAFLPSLRDRFGERIIAHADDESGLFDLAAHFRNRDDEVHVYVCGPTPFLEAALAATAHRAEGSVHFERFAALEPTTENVAFEVELAATGTILNVPADKSVLEVLKENGVPVLSSCTEGTCGTCEVAVIDGTIDHRDTVLSSEEQDSGEMMMVCVSRCRSGKLILDL